MNEKQTRIYSQPFHLSSERRLSLAIGNDRWKLIYSGRWFIRLRCLQSFSGWNGRAYAHAHRENKRRRIRMKMRRNGVCASFHSYKCMHIERILENINHFYAICISMEIWIFYFGSVCRINRRIYPFVSRYSLKSISPKRMQSHALKNK